MYPVEPQSLQTEWALFGSHGWFVYWASRFEKLGIFARSSSASRPSLTICGMYTPVGTTMS